MRHLTAAPAIGFIDRLLHRVGDRVGVKDRGAVDVPRSPADGLDQRPFGPQEAFLVGIEDRHQRHLRQVEALAKQVDTDQHIEHAGAQVADDLNALEVVDVGMQIPDLDAVLRQERGQIFGHALGQRGDQHAVATRHPQTDFGQHVVDLGARRAHFQTRIDQPGRPHHLLGDARRQPQLVIGRRGRHKDAAAHLALELVETQRPVVQRRRQPEPDLHQRFLARTVALVHAPELRHGNVRLVDDHQRVGGQIVDQRRRRLAGRSPRHVARVVLDALAEAQFVEHLEIEAGALLEALRLDQLAGSDKLRQPVAQFDLDALDRVEHGLARRHVVRRRVDREARDLLAHAAGQRVEQLQALDFVVEQLDPHRQFSVLGREDVDRVAAHAEGAARELGLVAAVLHRRQAGDDVALTHLVVGAQRHHHRVVVAGVADAVDRRDGGHDHRVAAFEQALGGRQPHLLDVLVDAAVLLDVEVARRDVGFRLVIVVIGDEVLDRVVREKLAHLRIELRRQRLVGCQHDRRRAGPGDQVGHREGLARSCDAKQRLEGQAIGQTLRQLGDRRRLIPCRVERRVQLEGRIGKGEHHGYCIAISTHGQAADCKEPRRKNLAPILKKIPFLFIFHVLVFCYQLCLGRQADPRDPRAFGPPAGFHGA